MDKEHLKKLINESQKREQKYDKILNEVARTFRELNSVNMQAVLIQIEDFLDRNHIYAFKNWIEGVLWDGPDIHRYWVKLTLKYNGHQMPDPRAAERLIKLGSYIQFEETTEVVPIEHPSGIEDIDPTTRKPKEVTRKIWLVHLCIPIDLLQAEYSDGLPSIDVVNDEIKNTSDPTTGNNR